MNWLVKLSTLNTGLLTERGLLEAAHQAVNQSLHRQKDGDLLTFAWNPVVLCVFPMVKTATAENSDEWLILALCFFLEFQGQ